MENSANSPPEKTTNRKAAIIAAIVVVLVVVGGLGLYFHFRQTSSEVTITIAAPVYSSSTSIWENYLNNSTAGWLKDHPGVTIKFVGPFGASSEGQYYTKLDLMTSSTSTAPSLMLEDMFYTSTYVNSGVLLPLNKYVSNSTFSKYFPAALDQMKVNGTYYGAPAQVTDTLIYYNKTLLQDAGISTPWQPKNWTDIINAAMQVKNTANLSGVIPLNVYEGVKADESSSFTGFEGLLYGTNWTLYNFTNDKWYGNNPGLYQTLNFYNTSFVKDKIATANLSATPYITVGQYMQQGKLAIAEDGSWMYGYQWAPGAQHPISNFSKYIGVAMIPTEFGQGQGYDTMVGGWGWAGYSGVANKSLIASLAVALSNSTNSITANLPGEALAGGLPATTTATGNPMFSKLMPTAPYLDTFYTQLLQYGKFRPPVSGYPQVSYQLDKAMSAVVHQTSSIPEALSAYSAALNSTFGSHNVQIISPQITTAASVFHNTFSDLVYPVKTNNEVTQYAQINMEPLSMNTVIPSSVFELMKKQ